MTKKYIFYKQDIINLLLNYKSHLSNKFKELVAEGKDPRYSTYKEIIKWTEEFFEETMKDGEVTVDSLLDKVDEVLAKTHGMTSRQMAEKIKEEEN